MSCLVTGKQGVIHESYESHEKESGKSSLSLTVKEKSVISSFLEHKRVGGLFDLHYFLETQGSGEVQYRQFPLLIQVYEYHLLQTN